MTPGEERILALARMAATDDDALAVLQDAVFEEDFDAWACVFFSSVPRPDWSGESHEATLGMKRRFVAACIVDWLAETEGNGHTVGDGYDPK